MSDLAKGLIFYGIVYVLAIAFTFAPLASSRLTPARDFRAANSISGVWPELPRALGSAPRTSVVMTASTSPADAA